MKLVVGVVVFGLAGPACASSTPRTPTAVADAWSAALAIGDTDGARRLMSRQAQQRAPRLPTSGDAPQDGREVVRDAQWGRQPLADSRWGVARLEDGWRVYGGVLPDMSARTPEVALKRFGRGIVDEDAASLWSVIPARQQRLWGGASSIVRTIAHGAAWRVLGDALLAGGGQMTRTEGGRAIYTINVGEIATTILLNREATAWKVFDVQPVEAYMESKAEHGAALLQPRKD